MEENKHANKKLNAGRGAVGKQAVLGIRKRGGHTIAVPVSDTTKQTLQGLVRKYVKPGSTLYTDDNPAYNGVFHRHKTVNHSAKEYVNGMAHTNGIESVWAVMKRGYNGVYHNWSKKHMARYVNEFTFRLNEGHCERDTQDRLNSLFRAMGGRTITYQELTA